MNPDSSLRRVEFRRYLENSGILDALTNALVKLFELPEKPTNPLSFLKECFMVDESGEDPNLKSENAELKEKVEALEKTVQELKNQLESDKGKSEDELEERKLDHETG
uniref:c-Myc-binding protein n=1 Tax=Mesocestoides corti TaxID=53468 RepID=A0A5K3ELI2_MESCO